MTTLTINYRCPCGAHPTLVTTGRPTRNEQSLIVHCPQCELDTQLLLRAIPLDQRRNTPNPAEHGTPSGYARHFRTGDLPPCRACKDAHANNVRERKARKRHPNR